jgi:hypothetical protein
MRNLTKKEFDWLNVVYAKRNIDPAPYCRNIGRWAWLTNGSHSWRYLKTSDGYSFWCVDLANVGLCVGRMGCGIEGAFVVDGAEDLDDWVAAQLVKKRLDI